MFEIENATDPSAEYSKQIVDHDRGLTVTYLGGLGATPGSRFLMRWRDMVFNAVTELRSVGGDVDVRLVEIWEFRERVERDGVVLVDVPIPWETMDEARFLLSEALLLFGDYFNGLTKPDGRYVADINGDRYSLSDFGYTPSG